METSILAANGGSRAADEPAAALVNGLTATLQRGDGRSEASDFLGACHRGILPIGPELRGRLLQALGEVQFKKLAWALVRHPCMYCDAGLELCAVCNGKGIRDGTFCCHTCTGFGRVRCDFCNGSGLAGYLHFPTGLRSDVLHGRITLAVVEIERLCDAAAHGDAGKPEVSPVGRILSLNKLLGVLENARTEMTRMLDETGPRAGMKLLLKRTDLAASKAFDAIRAGVVALATGLRRQGGTAQTPRSQAAGVRAEFYERLFAEDGDMAGTSLHHPFLPSNRGGSKSAS